jgi:1-acyl-sn-glycerol-3-phosphate acyltransferase
MDFAVTATDLRSVLLAHLFDFVGHSTDAERAKLVEVVKPVLDRASDASLEQLVQRVRLDDYAFDYHPPIALVRELHHVLADLVLPNVRLEGAELLQPVASESVILLPNHLSYADANVIEIFLHRAGFDALCARLTVIAGPKVYSDPWRRFSSLCFGTIKTAQSSGLATGEAVMRPRDVARIAQGTIARAFARLDAGDALLLFPEGTRSRDCVMQALLPAVARYVEREDLWIVPMGISGSENFYGMSDTRVRSSPVGVRVGQPLEAATLRARCGGNRAKIADALGSMIAQCLPPGYRPAA